MSDMLNNRLASFNMKNNYPKINLLPIEKRPFTYERPWEPPHLRDENGVAMYLTRRQCVVYNPRLTAEWALKNLDSWRQTRDEIYWERVKTHLKQLTRDVHRKDGLVLWPYNFHFRLHGKNEWMRAPWYSGMAQGMILCLLTRIHLLTGRRDYLDWARLVLGSLLIPSPVARIDHLGYYWIDEYPQPKQTFVLNGHLYGLYGLYEWWCATGDSKVYDYLQSAITTVHHYASQFVNPEGPSYYCLKHKVTTEKQDFKYHKTHIGQLFAMFHLTDDPFWLEMIEKMNAVLAITVRRNW